MTDMVFMYCRKCGWMNDKEGIGRGSSVCPGCGRVGLAFVQGTQDETIEFRVAIKANPEAYRQFPSSDYWDSFGKGRKAP